MVNLEREPFNNFSKLAAVVLLLFKLSAVIAHNYTKQGKQVFSTKNYTKIKNISYLIRQIVVYQHFM